MASHGSARLESDTERDTIASRPDLLRSLLWGAGLVLVAFAVSHDRNSLPTAAERTAPPFLTLAVVIAAGALADRLGVFRLLARVVLSERAPTLLASASLLTLTALISGVVNLDVAAVVAPPLAIRVAGLRRLNAARLVVATALTANATSFLLPTSNLTNLLVLDRSPISGLEYLRQGWAAWLLVTIVTVGWLALLTRRSTNGTPAPSPPSAAARPIVPTILDLLPMFVIASAIRSLLGAGLTLHGGFLAQFVVGSMLAAGANNLPAAAAIGTAATAVPWASICSMAMGPNLLVTGSLASIICRRSALDLGVRFESRTFSVLGGALLPLQFLAAWAGLALVRLA
jgi:Na+/H+ antiporter NhaD/arsenite permease-like protein